MRRSAITILRDVVQSTSQAPVGWSKDKVVTLGAHPSVVAEFLSGSNKSTHRHCLIQCTNRVRGMSSAAEPATEVKEKSSNVESFKQRLESGPGLADFIINNVDQYSVYAPKPKVGVW
jgi:hypothetical protein